MHTSAPESPLLDARYKGYPLQAPPCAVQDIGAQGWHLFAGDLPLPLAVLDRSALEHNLAWMQRWADARGLHLAPHGKTSMSPQLLARQLAAGAWGLTFANAWQAQLGAAVGARRILIANQVLQDADLSALHLLRQRQPGLQLWFLVDSLEQLALIEQWAARHPQAPAWSVLLEIGQSGQRTGCRSLPQALALAQAIAASAALRLCGIECYEGPAARCDAVHDPDSVSALVRLALAVARACDSAGLWAAQAPDILLSAGGSAVFDLVLPLLQAQGLSRPVVGVLRSGCYATHDHGNYQRYLRLLQARAGQTDEDEGLRPALSVWALVQSVPEPGLALLNAGRRDLSFDIDLPRPLQRAPAGARAAHPTPGTWCISALNDQHAYLRFDPQSPSATWPQVGERVQLGISHPCTTFDKWRWLPVVEDDGCVSGAVQTWF